MQFFDFQQSIVDPRLKALWIRHGALTHPLEITIYYVIDRTSQDVIVAHVEKFFSELPQRQYRIRFLVEAKSSWFTISDVLPQLDRAALTTLRNAPSLRGR